MIPQVAVLLGELEAFLELAATLTPQQELLPTECPGWTVHDQVAHVVAGESTLGGLPQPEHTLLEVPAHVRSPVGAFMEVGVDVRRALPLADLVAEGRAVLEHRRSTLADLGPDDLMASPFGDRPAVKIAPLRTFDVWAHEQDVRRAVGLPVTDDTPAAAASLGYIMGAVPGLLGKTVGLAEGQSVRFVVGDLDTTFVLDAGRVMAGPSADGAETPSVTVQGSVGELLRVTCGRVPAAASELVITGDPALAARLGPALAVTP